jgi:membrane-bound lytic murein transglycosylase F
VPNRSRFEQTLIELADSLTGDLQVIEVDASSEVIIREIAKGNVAYTISQGNLAQLQGSYFRNLLIRPVVGSELSVTWAARRDARMLLDTLNAWIDDEKRGALFDRLYKKYFIDARGYQTRVASRYLTSETGSLSQYDSLIKKNASSLGWDWRLLASQMYQESRFNPVAKSWAGARGLMQLMPRTARQFGVRTITDPRQNVEGGVRYIQWLEKYWSSRIADAHTRLSFVLASYNAGAGHVEDAQRLAEKHGDDPKDWDEVSYWLLQLSKVEYYADPVVKYGFCRGLEPVTYVSLIFDRFQHYKQFVQVASD